MTKIIASQLRAEPSTAIAELNDLLEQPVNKWCEAVGPAIIQEVYGKFLAFITLKEEK